MRRKPAKNKAVAATDADADTAAHAFVMQATLLHCVCGARVVPTACTLALASALCHVPSIVQHPVRTAVASEMTAANCS